MLLDQSFGVVRYAQSLRIHASALTIQPCILRQYTTFDLERTAGSVLRERSLASGSTSATSARGTSSLILHLPIEDITLPRCPVIARLNKPPFSFLERLRSRVPGNTYSPWSSYRLLSCSSTVFSTVIYMHRR